MDNNIKPKKEYALYYIVISICLSGILYFIMTVLPNTRKYSSENLEKLLEHLDKKFKNSSYSNKAFPFFMTKEYNSSVFIDSIAYYEYYNTTNKTINIKDTLQGLKPMRFFRHINIWLFQNKEEGGFEGVPEIIGNSLLLNNDFFNSTVVVKTLYIKDHDITSKSLYKDVVRLNSEYAVDEMLDEGALNIHLLVSKNEENFSYYNPDFDKEIFVVSFDNLKKKGIQNILFYTFLSSQFKVNKYLHQDISLISFDDLKEYFYYKLLLLSIKNLDIVNVSVVFFF